MTERRRQEARRLAAAGKQVERRRKERLAALLKEAEQPAPEPFDWRRWWIIRDDTIDRIRRKRLGV